MSESPPQWVAPENDGEHRLAVDLVPAAGTRPRLWFFLHGLNSHRRGEKALYFARQVARRGDAFASLDLTGHGDSEGDLKGLTLSRNLNDLDRGLRHAEAALGPVSAVHLVGSSMGAITALWYSVLHPDRVAANLLIAPAFEMAGRLLLSLGPKKAQAWRETCTIRLQIAGGEFDLDYGFVRDETRYPIADLVRKLRTPTLILHGLMDDSVPHQLSKSFVMRAPVSKLVLIEGGDHRLTDHKELLFHEMWEFVATAASSLTSAFLE